MPEILDLPTWLSLSSSLLQARPQTTRITTKYTVLSSAKNKKRLKRDNDKAKADDSAAKASESESTASKRRATFTIKTFDAVSGSTLVYKTTKASDLGMIMRNLGGLSADMAGIARSAVSIPGTGATTSGEAAVQEAGEDEEPPLVAGVTEEGGENKGKAKKKKKGKGKR